MPPPRTDTGGAEKLQQAIKQKKFSPLYFFYGEEDLLIEESVDALIEHALDPPSRNFNLDVLSGAEMDARQIVSAASSFPMMGERRLVVVRDAEKIPNKDPLLPYFASPSPTTVLVLVSLAPDFRQKFFKALKESATCVQFAPLSESDIQGWISQRLGRSGRQIAPDAIQLLQIHIGRSLRDLHNELEKLLIYTGERTRITSDDVTTVVGRSKTHNIFQLQKALGQMEKGRAIEILERVLAAGESPIGMLVMLTRYYQKLWLAQELRQQKLTPGELASRLGVPAFTVREYIDASGRFSAPDLEACFDALLDADQTLKSTSLDPRTVMTTAILRCFPARTASKRQ